ncbi:hypothetical protein HPB48_018050 [Haemaphysalis longicornis]|uniref:Fucosyltransferase n=1 Tax=Haemaphysalis longicornis TaxID=44386 RepID=A0A9J6FPK3_HAELO|nr:hypothetical protein HPB48_018050 [Haemaphysalis longicornis]
MAGWAVSHCKTASRREEYVEELRKYATVDVYGECGTKKCPRKISSECYQLFAKKYFFYLSFENSICREYVTEKLFNVLHYDIIPVVLGGANYTAIAPPDSFIDALTFRSPKHLAEHLRSVAGDFELYRKYLRWKTNHAVLGSTYGLSLCRLCKKLHSPSFRQTTIIRDVFYWFSNMSNCRSWNFTH